MIMKKLYFLVMFLPFLAKSQTTYTSQTNGDWNTPATWNPNGVPGQLDNVIINNNVTATIGSVKCHNLTINSGGILNNTSSDFTVYNLATNNTGGIWKGSGQIEFGGPVNSTFITGGGDFSQQTGIWYFDGTPLSGTSTEIIDASVNILRNNTIYIFTAGWGHAIRILNFGNITMASGTIYNYGSFPDSWVQEAGSSLTISQAILINSRDSLIASANGNTINCSGSASYTIKNPVASTFYNLTLSGSGTHSLGANTVISNNLLMSSGTFDLGASNFSVTLGGNWTKNGFLNPRNSTITFNGVAGQTIGGTSSTGFYNLVLQGNGGETVSLSSNENVNNNLTISGGTLDCKTFQITGNAVGTFSMASGSSMLLGSTLATTNILFPTLFTSANIALNANSTVTYQTNGAQTVSNTPTYGNLIISTGASPSTKTPTGTPLNIGGNLTLNANSTLSQTTSTINLTGNLTDNGTLSFSTGNLNVGGNFSNNGTYTTGTNTVTLTGTTGQTVGGTSVSTFNNLTAQGNSNETVTLGNNQMITNNLLISGGTFDVSASNYSVGLAGNLTNNGTFNAQNGVVTLNGNAGQALGGSNSIAFYDLTIAGGAETVSLNTNESFSDVLTMSSGTLAGPSIMTLMSSAAKTARIAPILPGGGSITANFIVQRYDGRTVANYEVITSPVQSTTLGDWNTSNRTPPFYMSGVGGPDGNANGGYVSVYLYLESTNTYSAITNFASPGISYLLPQAQGIFLWMGNDLLSMSPFTYITHGVPTVGSVNYNVTKTAGQGNGFNLIGNPYPSPLSWSNFSASNPSLQSSYYLFEQDGSWHTFTNITGPNIPMEQGFGVVTNSSTSLSFFETNKSATDAALEREQPKEANSATFTLGNDANSFSCPTILSFGSDNVSNYNSTEDAIFIKSYIPEVPEIYSISGDNKNLSLNRLPEDENEVYVPLVAIGNVVANYTLTATDISTLPYQCVCLIDRETGNVLNNFSENPSYTFPISEVGQQKSFFVRFTKLSAGQSCNSLASVSSMPNISENIDIYSINSGAMVNFNLPKQENAVISVYDVMGQKVMEDITTNALDNSVMVNLPAKQQIYILRVTTPGGVTTKKLYY